MVFALVCCWMGDVITQALGAAHLQFVVVTAVAVLLSAANRAMGPGRGLVKFGRGGWHVGHVCVQPQFLVAVTAVRLLETVHTLLLVVRCRRPRHPAM